MNILQINHYVGPPPYCPAYRPTLLARQWVRMGHRAVIVGASYSHQFASMPSFRGSVRALQDDGIDYVMLKTPPYHGNGASRVANMLAFVGQLRAHAGFLARTYRPDAVIAGSAYLLDSYPGRRIARRAGARFVREVRDLWPLTLISLGGISPRHPMAILLQRAENFTYAHADLVVTTLPKSLDHMSRHGLDPSRWAYVPQGVDVSRWRVDDAALPEEHRRLLDSLAAEGRFLLGYVGSHGTANALGLLVEAAGLLRERPVTILLVGKGPEKERLRRTAAAAGLVHMRFLPPVPQEALPALLTRMDATFLGWARSPIYRYGISPNKLMDYMMAGRPIVHAVEAGNDLVTESGCGISVPPDRPDAIAGAVARLIEMTPEEREAMGSRGREFVRRFHDYRILAARYLELLSRDSTAAGDRTASAP